MENEEDKGVSTQNSKVKILLISAGSAVGILISLIWILFLSIISYIEPFKADIFLPSWYHLGFFLAIVPTIGDLMQHVWKLVLHKEKINYAIKAGNELITSLCTLLLAMIYPLDLGELDELGSVVLYLLAGLSFLSSLSSASKYFAET